MTGRARHHSLAAATSRQEALLQPEDSARITEGRPQLAEELIMLASTDIEQVVAGQPVHNTSMAAVIKDIIGIVGLHTTVERPFSVTGTAASSAEASVVIASWVPDPLGSGLVATSSLAGIDHSRSRSLSTYWLIVLNYNSNYNVVSYL